MTVQQDEAAVLRCRYQYATGCEYEGSSKQALYAHERLSPAHAAHRIELTACPVCGKPFDGEHGRGLHLANEHGIKAKTEQRQELDARQVAELYATRYGTAEAVLPVPSSNGHAPDPAPVTLDLLAAQEAFAALVAEVESLRAENAALRTEAAVLRQVRSVLAV
jgi:hypothetical protein